MTLSVQSLVNALGEQVTTKSCDLCQVNHSQDFHGIAIGMREATISWTRSLKCPEEIFKPYGLNRGLGRSGTEEAGLAAFENRPYDILASVRPSQRRRVPQVSAFPPASGEDFPMHVPKSKTSPQPKHLSAKLRMEIVLQEREAMFKELEAEHKRRVWELQTQSGLDDACISADNNEKDITDEQIDFYLDDDSIPISERIRSLTYVAPQRSHDNSNSSSPQTPSPPGPRKVDGLPAIPPVSPLHFTESGFLADPAENFHRISDRIDGQCDASHSERSVKTVETASEGDLDGDTLGPASRGSSGVASRMGPEIRTITPPRPARVPFRCITHGVEKQNGCQGCEVGTFWEIGLKPGQLMSPPGLEPGQF
ncbi:hypothetical protein LZ31DRAFT_521371 [Colletotrichum somersetense]|nr:hypothetical protein LZ31DRAFT_521371 [Colletotrichum somersetense]